MKKSSRIRVSQSEKSRSRVLQLSSETLRMLSAGATDAAPSCPSGVTETQQGASAKPAGVFVIKDGTASWVPAVDAGRIAMMGILVGLVASTLAGVAMVRRPPWPDLHGDVSRRR